MASTLQHKEGFASTKSNTSDSLQWKPAAAMWGLECLIEYLHILNLIEEAATPAEILTEV